MAIPRSQANSTFTAGAVRNPAANDTFTAITAGSSTLFTLALPRSFKPQKPLSMVFPAGLQAGLNVGQPYITGNSPSSGATPAVYSVNFTITNNTGGSLTPTAQKVAIIQD